MNIEDIIIEEVGNMIEEFQNSINDRLDAIEKRIEIVDSTNSRIIRDVPNEIELQQFEERLHDRIDGLTAIMGEYTNLPGSTLAQKDKIGTRMNAIETKLDKLENKYVDNIGVFCEALIEVKGQISDPARKLTAIEDLRQRVKASHKTF